MTPTPTLASSGNPWILRQGHSARHICKAYASTPGNGARMATHRALPSVGYGIRQPAPLCANNRLRSSLPTGIQAARDSAVISKLGNKQRGRNGKSNGNDEEPEDKDWKLFDAQAYAYKWNVPWGAGTTVSGLVLWFLSFIAVGIIAVPGLYRYAGADIGNMSEADQALFTLACQAAETVVGCAVIRVVTAGAMKAKAAAGEEEDQGQLFNYSPKAPFAAPYGWGAWALGGVVLSPLIVGATATLVSIIGYDNVGGKGTVDGVVEMVQADLPTYGSLLMVTGVLAPILEETVFRGFLLTSLTSLMPTWAAVGLSSFLFGAAHLSPRDLPVLCALGCLLGVSYVRSRNLLTPIIIHGVWNSAVLTLLFGLAASGFDVETAIQDYR